MEFESVVKALASLGGLGIVALLIFKLPSIIDKYNTGVQLVINSIKESQKEALVLFKDQMIEDRKVYVARFEKIESGIEKLIESMVESNLLKNQLLTGQKDTDRTLSELETAIHEHEHKVA